MSENTDLHARLIPAAQSALDDTAALLGMSRTEVVNRAIQLYAFVEMERRAAGCDLATIEPDGSVQVITFDGEAPQACERFRRAQVRRRPRPSWWPWKRREAS